MDNKPNYYMIITNLDDYYIDYDNDFQFIGFPKRNKKSVQTMKPGDKVVFYVTKKSVFMASVEIIGKYFFSTTQYWSDEFDVWPHRIKTKPLVAIDYESQGVHIKEIWDNLEFIVNKKKWGSQVMGSFRRITEHDYDIITKSITNKLKSNI